MVTVANKPQVRVHVHKTFLQPIEGIIRHKSCFGARVERPSRLRGLTQNNRSFYSEERESVRVTNRPIQRYKRIQPVGTIYNIEPQPEQFIKLVITEDPNNRHRAHNRQEPHLPTPPGVHKAAPRPAPSAIIVHKDARPELHLPKLQDGLPIPSQ